MAFETILFETHEGEHGNVAQITLDRPEVRNAINAQMIQELSEVIDSLKTRKDINAIVLTGAGEKAFAAGADIEQLRDRDLYDALLRINAGLFRKLEDQPLPTIAAIRGHALGGGCELSMACDIRIAGAGAKLGQPEVALGIIPGAGAIQRLPRLVGLGRAKELIFTGRIIDAQEAERIGLVNKVVPDDQVVSEAIQMAQAIAKQGQLAVQVSKLALNAAGRPNPAFESLDVLGQALLFETTDKRERMQAFLDRRAAKKARKE